MSGVRRRLRALLEVAVAPAPVRTCVGAVVSVLSAVATPLATAGAGALVTALVTRADPLPGLLLVAAGMVAAGADSLLYWWCWAGATDRGARWVRHRLVQLLTGIPTLTHLHDPDVADRVAAVVRDAPGLAALGRQLVLAVSTLVSAVSVTAVLASVHPALALLVLLGLLPAWTSARHGVVRREAEFAQTDRQRFADAVFDIARDPDLGIEVRCSGTGPSMLHEQHEQLTARIRAVAAAGRRTRRQDLAAQLLWVAALGVAVVAVFAGVRAGSLPVGALLTTVLLVPTIEGSVSSLGHWASVLARTWRRISTWDDVVRYAAEVPRGETAAPRSLQAPIRLSGAGYRYPGADRPALADLTLQLQPGTVVAVVGENGAGKSTLVQVLCGLLPVTDGVVEVGGRPLSELEPGSWCGQLTAAFQDHADFSFTVAESVALADPAASRERVLAALGAAGADEVVAGLPAGANTQLGRQFTDGSALSGGQWQRLAIARGLLRDRVVLALFDEPTSALDPAAEDRILRSVLDRVRGYAAATGAVAVLVSHRMSTVRAADRVLVLQDGRVVEDGDHDALVAAGGAYAELYDLQARHYR